MKFKVPQLTQDAKNCWYFCLQMIIACDKGLDQEVAQLQAVGNAPNTGITLQAAPKVLPKYGFAPVPNGMLSPQNCEPNDFEQTLLMCGPLFCGVYTTKFGFKSNHALVVNGITGAGENAKFFYHDPANEAGESSWPLDYLLLLTDFADEKELGLNETPFWYLMQPIVPWFQKVQQ